MKRFRRSAPINLSPVRKIRRGGKTYTDIRIPLLPLGFKSKKKWK